MSFRACLLFCLAAGGTLLCGCMVHRPREAAAPLVPAAPEFHEAPAEERGELAGAWWASFEDPALNQVIDEALGQSLELEQFAARIEQAQALARQARAALFPALDAGADFEARRINPDGGPSFSEEASSMGAFLNWELDLWGRLRSARRAGELEARAAMNDWLGARLLLSASIAETYFEILEQRRQLRLLHEQIEANETLYDLTRLRFGQGQSSIVDVLQQQEQLAATRALVPEIQARLEQLGYALDVLAGQAPGAGEAVPAMMLEPPPPVPETGVPSDLLLNRPDLRAAADVVKAIDYRVGEAIANRLPRVAIGGSAAAAGDPTPSSLITSAVASLTAPIFDAGSRRAEVAFRRSQLREAAARFSEIYLEAIRDVETALLLEKRQREQVRRIEEQLDIAQRLLRETRNRYAQGLTDYLPVLNAVVTVQALERRLLTSRRAVLSFRVALHRAIGGPMPPPENDSWQGSAS